MKFKEIKSDIVIHCPKEEDARTLLKCLDSMGYKWYDKFDLKYTNEYSIWSWYGSDTSFRIRQHSRTIEWGRLQKWQRAGLAITEFSDLIEPEPKFKIGDKVKVRSDLKDGEVYGGLTCKRGMQIYAGKIKTIIWVSEISNKYRLDDNPLDDFWTDEMLEPVDDSPMTAVEVLEWFGKNSYNGETMREVFGKDAVINDIVANFGAQAVIDKITAYEAAKKAPKPVEVKWVDICRIIQIQIQDNGSKKCVYEEEVNPYVAYGTGEEGNLSFDPKYGAENVLKNIFQNMKADILL